MTDDEHIRENLARLHRDGRPVNGGIHLVAEVHCAICEEPHLGLPYPIAAAEAELRRAGWTTRLGAWICHRHAPDRSRR